MRIECPKCHKKYEVEDMYIPIGGGPVRCPNCKNIFGIYVEPMDIPMTEIIEDDEQPAASAGTPFTTPEIGETSFSPEYAPQEEQANSPADSDNLSEQLNDLGSFSSSVPETETAFAQPTEETQNFGNISFDPAKSAPVEEAKPSFSQSMDDFGVPPAFAQPAQPKTAEPAMPDFGASPFAQPKPAAPQTQDFGVPPAFAQPTQPKTAEPAMPDFGASPFAQPKPAAPQTQDFGVPPAFAQPTQPKTAEPAMPDFGASPFAQPKPAAPQTQDFGAVPPAFAQQKPVEPVTHEPMPFPAAKPAPQPQQSAPVGHIKPGGAMFDVLLAGFNLPPNFSSMPENMQKVHKDAVKLARQLAKDILLYHKDEVEKGMANGNIKESMKDEIEKSYKFYTQRIQPEIISSSNYFNEALNKIVAKGQKIF
ncbi:MAG: zinc-ribbon domain-containing protein [bacterium]